MNATILLASNDQQIISLRSAIEGEGSFVVIANSFDTAKLALTEEEIHLAIIDEDFCSLGKGWELASIIRRDLDIPLQIILLSKDKKHAYTFYKIKAYEDLFDWILLFPIGKEYLLREIRRQLILKEYKVK